ncbi:hypothetical protein [Archaeoglobus fulgidus]|jgi:hypothetical protein|uniref:Uncharacterized protein AF_0956 n=4 Tax=Archaeoglobus fulgidus TaxID=2234 RepID=Y956_ARCFU|nr:hypothetical protein [Archaeoglobus fulgidus]O29306.1 RecName: Full=Uncharacterized protein AF_0956 [Archaeoglobus fulgidus DSM 4304]AIG97829.1 hypothetical protein AFULGI_00010460 [Archaeoglobus fulgidus DSM 8774]AAB90293.1 predicted coding region AF_0956 [Archaeoglobus fulgidus DSM 4304]KUJ93137.1 MAG: hypothetical protein XD40_1648 [Archaeoglobus fulgidus]KUK06811.1 MAG: Uncharacterized protein XD48_0974 [Archaeoglobus fulgidus]
MNFIESFDMDDEEKEKLLEKLASQQLRADYRKALGSEHKRRYMDMEIEKIFKKGKKDER